VWSHEGRLAAGSTAFDHSDRVRECGRSGRYRLADLLMPYGRNEKFAFTQEVTPNCARKQARSDSDPCGAIYPDLPKAL